MTDDTQRPWGNQTCGRCRYWLADSEGPKGDCFAQPGGQTERHRGGTCRHWDLSEVEERRLRREMTERVQGIAEKFREPREAAEVRDRVWGLVQKEQSKQ